MCKALCCWQGRHRPYPGELGASVVMGGKARGHKHCNNLPEAEEEAGQYLVKWWNVKESNSSPWPGNADSALTFFFFFKYGEFCALSHVNWHRPVSAAFFSTYMTNKQAPPPGISQWGWSFKHTCSAVPQLNSCWHYSLSQLGAMDVGTHSCLLPSLLPASSSPPSSLHSKLSAIDCFQKILITTRWQWDSGPGLA